MTETVTIEGIVIDENDVISISDRGGWNAPSHKTERGFEYDSYVHAEPIEVAIEATVDRDLYQQELTTIRDRETPIAGASIGQVAMAKAKLENLETMNEPTPENRVRCTITLAEIQEAETESATVTIQTGDGQQGTSSEDTPPDQTPTEGDGEGGGDGAGLPLLQVIAGGANLVQQLGENVNNSENNG